MTGEGGLVETSTPPVETPAASEAEVIHQRLLGIVKKRLENIANPPPQEGSQEGSEEPESQEQKERINTAQVLLDILEGSEKPMASFTTTLKPIEEQPPPTTESESPKKQAPPQEEPSGTPSEKPQKPPAEKPQPITYTVVGISEGDIVTAKDSQENEVQFSLSALAVDMAQTVGLPPHQIEVIIAQLKHERERAQLNIDQELLARKFGFFTREFLCELFDIPTDKKERQKALDDSNIPEQVKKVIGEIDNLPTLPDTKQVCQVFSKAGLSKDKPLSEIINQINEKIEKLPEDQREGIQQLVNIVNESIGTPEVKNQTLRELITNYYQQLEAGEDVAVDLPEIIDSLVTLQQLKEKINEQQKNVLINKIIKWGEIGGGVTIALILIFLLKGAGEMTGNSSH